MLMPSDASGAVLVSPVLGRLPRVVSGFTTRRAGTVAAPGRPGDDDAVDRALAGGAGAWRRRLVSQVHGAACLVVTPATPEGPEEADALVTADAGELLIVRTADCLPVLAVAVGARGVAAVAAIHAGWRGVLAGVIEQSVGRLRALAPESRLVAALGPAIGPCCFEVGDEVATPFVERFGSSVARRAEGARPHVDLPSCARTALAALGVAVPDPQPPPCTRCAPDVFHSHRADGASAGRMAAYVGLAR